jgi:hypothetical protein
MATQRLENADVESKKSSDVIILSSLFGFLGIC